MMVTELSGVQFGCSREGNSLVVLWGKWGCWFRIMKVSLQMSSGAPCWLSGISLFPSYFNFQQHPDPIFCIIFNISLSSTPPPPNPNPQKKFYLFKTFGKSESSHIYWTNDYDLMAPCKRTKHCWTNDDGSCCVRLPVAYGTIFWLNDILARFGRKRQK